MCCTVACVPSRNWSHGLEGFFRFPSFVPVYLGTTFSLTLWGTRFTNPYSGVECLVGHQRDRDISCSGHARYSRPYGARRDVIVTRLEA